MAVTAHVYGQFLLDIANKLANMSTDALKVALVTSTYTPNLDTDQYWSTPQANEISGTGYTAGGAALTSVTSTYDSTAHAWELKAANVSWPSSTLTARYAVIYDSTPGTAATDQLIAYVDFGANVVSTNAAFNINWAAAGIVNITTS